MARRTDDTRFSTWKYKALFAAFVASCFAVMWYVAGQRDFGKQPDRSSRRAGKDWRSHNVPTLGQQAFFYKMKPPWENGRISISAFLAQPSDKSGPPIESTGKPPDSGRMLPDDEIFHKERSDSARWSAGALDGVLSHHSPLSRDEATERKLVRQLREAVAPPSTRGVAELYDTIVSLDSLVPYANGISQAIVSDPPMGESILYDFAVWLMTKSPDRNAVKLGILLQGLFEDVRPDEIVRIGKHDEFTLFSVIALEPKSPKSDDYEKNMFEKNVWDIAKQTGGWGRIQAVERLFNTGNPEIQKWLLRVGYDNSVSIGYLALGCARGGRLLSELKADTIDDDLLRGAGEILCALFRGGPFGDIIDYEDGRDATLQYLRHLERVSPNSPLASHYASEILAFVDSDAIDWTALAETGWNEASRKEIGEKARRITRRKEPLDLTEQNTEQLNAPDARSRRRGMNRNLPLNHDILMTMRRGDVQGEPVILFP